MPNEVIPPRIRPGTCSKCSILVPNTTRRALSNDTITFTKSLIIAPKVPRIPPKQGFSLVIPPRIRPGTCSKCSNDVPSTTQRVLSNGTIRFFKCLFFVGKVPRIPSKQRFSLVIPPRIRLGTCSKRSNDVSSTTRRALSNGTSRFFLAQTIV
jgi:RNase P subunit RPR2